MNYPASFASQEFTPDQLAIEVLGTGRGTLLTGENIVRGTVLGKVTKGAVTPAVTVGDGDGTFAATPVKGAQTQVGVYTLVCVQEEESDADCIFSVHAPSGERLKDLVVGEAYSSPHFTGTLQQGVTVWQLGDTITLTIAAGSGGYKKSVAAAVDGSQDPDSIAVEDCDATSADKTVLRYTRGRFLSTGLTLGAGHTVASITDALRDKGIDIESPVVEA